MKKLLNLVLILLLLPNIVNACPHVDKNGVSHFQLYNDDYSEMTMLYPRLLHLYGKNVPLEEDGSITDENQDNILSESFGFPLVQDKQTYWYNYWFTDKDLMDGNWKDQDIKTTVEDVDSLVAEGRDYKLTVGLPKTFTESKKFMNDEITEMYYNVFVNKLNEQDKGKQKYESIIKDYEMNLIIPDIIEIKAEYGITSQSKDFQFSHNRLELDQFYDNIKYQVKVEESAFKVVAVNLLEEYNSNNIIECAYSNDSYSFSIDKPGVYILIEKQDIIKEINEYSENNSKFNILYIIIPIAIILAVISFIIYKRK